MLAVEVLQVHRRSDVGGMCLPKRLLPEAATDGLQRMPRHLRRLLPEAGTARLSRQTGLLRRLSAEAVATAELVPAVRLSLPARRLSGTVVSRVVVGCD